MKTLITAAIIGSMLFASCKKDGRLNPSPNITENSVKENTHLVETKITAENNLLSFASKDDYAKTINNQSVDNGIALEQQIRKLQFTSLETQEMYSGKRTSTSDEDIDDDFLKSILNKDNAVIIGEYIYRLNLKEELVYVLPKANINEYNDLVAQNMANPNIMIFSTGDDVIDQVEAGNKGKNAKAARWRPFCNESGCGERELSKYFEFKDSGGNKADGTRAQVEYVRAGIYFSLHMQSNNGFPQRALYYSVMQAGWKVKCGNYGQAGTESNVYSGGSGVGNTWKKQFYQSVQPLNGLRLRCIFTYKPFPANLTGLPNDDNTADLTIFANM